MTWPTDQKRISRPISSLSISQFEEIFFAPRFGILLHVRQNILLKSSNESEA
ncbi:MAG: hypothetical protein WAV41_00615 [Microgenomates group bacterium]